MHKKNKLKAIVAFAVALAFMVPTSAMFANDVTKDVVLVNTIVRFEPPSQTVETGETFTASYYVEPMDWIMGANFVTISFDPTLLQANSVTKGTFFGGKEMMFSGGTINNAAGTISDGFALVFPADAVTTPGSVFVIEFTAKDTLGTSALTMSGVTVKNNTGVSIPITVQSGSVTVTEYLNLTISVDGHGTTVPAAPGSPYIYPSGTVVNLTATPDLGWSFDHWTGGVDDPNSAITNITMDANKTVTAYFTEDHYILSVSTVGNGHVDVVPDKAFYLYGEEPELTAVPDSEDWTFKEWTGDLTGSENPTTIFMDGNKDVTATFTGEQPPTIIYVDDNADPGWYDTTHVRTIQEGVKNVSECGSVFVYEGVYHEEVSIDKEIHLHGQNRDTTIIDSIDPGSSCAIFIKNDGSGGTITGFTIKCFWGCAIMTYSNYNHIIGNIIKDSNVGIGLSGSYGSIIADNVITNNRDRGMVLVNSVYNVISGNSITGNEWAGVFLFDGSSWNTLSNNTFADNFPGIWVAGGGAFSSHGNQIYYNYFIDNAVSAIDESSNMWYHAGLKRGNYWSDFDEPSEGAYDENGDGIVDAPYDIGGGNQDKYPFLLVFGAPGISAEYPMDGSAFVELNPTLSADVFDYQGDVFSVMFMSNASGVWTQIGDTQYGGNGTFTQPTSNMGEYGTTYWWSVNASDGVHWRNKTYCFTTLTDDSIPWWDDEWKCRKTITISDDTVADDLSDFPILISIIDSDLAAHAQRRWR